MIPLSWKQNKSHQQQIFCIGVILCLKIFYHDIFSSEFPWWTLCWKNVVGFVLFFLLLNHSILFPLVLLFVLLLRNLREKNLNNIFTACIQWSKFQFSFESKHKLHGFLGEEGWMLKYRRGFMKRQIYYSVLKTF